MDVILYFRASWVPAWWYGPKDCLEIAIENITEQEARQILIKAGFDKKKWRITDKRENMTFTRTAEVYNGHGEPVQCVDDDLEQIEQEIISDRPPPGDITPGTRIMIGNSKGIFTQALSEGYGCTVGHFEISPIEPLQVVYAAFGNVWHPIGERLLALCGVIPDGNGLTSVDMSWIRLFPNVRATNGTSEVLEVIPRGGSDERNSEEASTRPPTMKIDAIIEQQLRSGLMDVKPFTVKKFGLYNARCIFDEQISGRITDEGHSGAPVLWSGTNKLLPVMVVGYITNVEGDQILGLPQSCRSVTVVSPTNLPIISELGRSVRNVI
jgi:hypothetical protein